MNAYKKAVLATGLLAGTIIGAGIFSLPYLVTRVGLLLGFVYLLCFTAVYAIVHYMYARVVETREKKHEFFYFSRAYLPRPLALIARGNVLGTLFFGLTVYLVLAPTFSSLIVPLHPVTIILIFWIVGSLLSFMRVTALGFTELLGLLGIVVIIFIVAISGEIGSALRSTSFIKSTSLATLLLPFGPLLFSFSGRSAIPQVVEEHRSAKKEFSLKKVVVWGTAIPAVVYGFFIIVVLSINPHISPETLNGLFLSPYLLFWLGIMGLITLLTSYFMIGANLLEILSEDIKLPKIISSVLVLGVPLGLYFVGFQNFLVTLSFAGGVLLGLEGIFVVMMWYSAFRSNAWRWVRFPLYAVFGVAIVYELTTFVL